MSRICFVWAIICTIRADQIHSDSPTTQLIVPGSHMPVHEFKFLSVMLKFLTTKSSLSIRFILSTQENEMLDLLEWHSDFNWSWEVPFFSKETDLITNFCFLTDCSPPFVILDTKRLPVINISVALFEGDGELISSTFSQTTLHPQIPRIQARSLDYSSSDRWAQTCSEDPAQHCTFQSDLLIQTGSTLNQQATQSLAFDPLGSDLHNDDTTLSKTASTGSLRCIPRPTQADPHSSDPWPAHDG
jgi:hypothetical protein